jgi:hypothetical protein
VSLSGPMSCITKSYFYEFVHVSDEVYSDSDLLVLEESEEEAD